MKRRALFALAALVLAACQDTTQPEQPPPIQSAQFTVINVPGDHSTVQAAINAASPGDTILVGPGTYVDQIELDKAVTLASHYLTTGDTSYISSTILDGGNGSYVIAIPSGTPDGATIQGFTIRNSDDGITPRARFNLLNSRITDTSDGIDFEDGSGGLIQFCTFELNSDDGLDLDNSVDVVIQDNIIRNNDDDGIEIRMQSHSGSTLNIIITRNVIHGNGEDGIQLIWYDVPTDRFFEISYNYIYDNADVGIGMMDGSVTSEDFRAASIPERINIFNNTFANNSHGITGGDNTVVLNNIFVGHPVIAVKNVDGNSELAYNLFYNNGTDNSGSNVDVGSSVFADPLLTANLELQAGSPAIDAGTAFYIWQTETVLDLLPEAYSGAAPDMGAFESEGGTGPPPDAPVLAAPADGALDLSLTPTLSWTGDGDSFSVEVATEVAFTNIVDAAVVSTTEYTVAVGALDYTTTYFWHVNASNANGTSDYSAVWSFTTEAASAPPDPPVLVAPADGATDVPLEAVLEWAGTADDFDVEVATDAAFTAVVYSTNTTSTTVTLSSGTLAYETTYYWHVRGNNAFGAGDFSTPFSFTTVAAPDTEPPSQPQNLSSPAQTGTTVDLVWDASTDNVGVSFYRIYRDGVEVASESSTNHTAVGLTPATSYDFQVSAVDDAGNESTLSAVLTVTTLDTIEPTAPGTPTLDSKTETTVSISWGASTDNVGVTEYRVFRDGVEVGTVAAPTTSFTDTGLAPATTYAYHVTALDAAGNESPASGTLEVTTDPGPEPEIHVGGIAMELKKAGNWNIGRAVISIVDESGYPVSDATVVAQWSGLATDIDSGITSGGDVQFDSDKVANSLSGQFIVTVTDVSASGFVYDPAANVQTAGCIDTAGDICSVGPPDTIPPAAPTSLTATAGPGSVSLDWADNTTDLDWASFSVYRSETAGSGHVLIAEGLTSSQFTDTGLTAGTTYYYVVTAKDTSGNESGPSNEASATPTAPPELSIHVGDISVAIVKQGVNYLGRATVLVLDQYDNPASGVEVVGAWTWNSADIGASSGITDGNGYATVDSAKRKASSGDVFEFTVTNLILNGYTYEPADNVKTKESATVP
ncbi:MAG: right-handed parallel beta-helix repeat-containing protein [Gemmatimonadota bacterium]|nr:MAG: right-handed parallel beta-helix repeat-containing protein [Gemmatimonadota bacterium]